KIAAAAEMIRERTGIFLSPYFPAAKIAWLLEHTEGAKEKAAAHTICHGTVDSFLVYRLSKEHVYRTDYSNASRTQLFDLHDLTWNAKICELFGIDPENMPQVSDSDGNFGTTDLGGFLDHPVPIHAAMGDSHAALFGQGCFESGMTKATYGTGSSVMMNVGDKPVFSPHGVVSSIGWGMQGKVCYVLEGNINYTGAVITWLKDQAQLISSAKETAALAKAANQEDRTYFVPAFTGLGAPYWKDDATAILTGMTRTTGKNEIVKAAVECIAYQIADIVEIMGKDSGLPLAQLRVDGGPTGNDYLMQFQSDLLRIPVSVAPIEELSGMGAAYAAGIGCGLYRKEEIFGTEGRTTYLPKADAQVILEKKAGWSKAVAQVMGA
nr:glycerol kinase [Lachnospiraceae bacterium]